MSRWLFICMAALALLPGFAPIAAAVGEPQVLIARAWGLAKYHHPQLVACAVDWDAALLDRWDTLEAADADGLDAALGDLLAAAGATPRLAVGASTPEWIATAPVSLPLREQLAWLAAQRPQSQCKVTPAAGTGQAVFDADNAHGAGRPDRARRALAAFRYWNAIEYFFPYKDDIGRDWAGVLQEHLPLLLDADPDQGFVTAMRRFTAQINDSHGSMLHPAAGAEFGAGFPPLSLRPIEGRTLVVTVAAGDWGVAVGDEVLEIDGEPVAQRIARLDADAHGSNPAWRLARVHARLGAGPEPVGSFVLQRPDGSRYSVALPRANGWPAGSVPPPVWRRELLDGCTIGVVDLGRLQPAEVDSMFAALGDTDALLFDVRNYPQGVLWDLADRLFDAPREVAIITRPALDRPGSFVEHGVSFGGARPTGYAGRILLLQNESSISHSEYTLMGLQASGRAISFGSQTAGADGNVTRIHTPGELVHTITGLGVFYPDGRATQRVGIVPDVHVARTRAGIIAGRDEVLEAALDCHWIDAQVPKRLPAAGLYSAAERSGEGIDVQPNVDGTIAVFSYGYDDDGAPEWLLSAGDGSADDWSRSFFRRTRDGSVTPLDGYVLDAHAGPYRPACAIADQNALHPRASWQWPQADAAGHSVCVRPLLLADGHASGTWAGSGTESGWGVSLHHGGGTLGVVVYAYDDAGNPRWLMGTTAWSGAGPVEVPLTRVRGFCRGCPPAPLEFTDAGVLELGLDGGGEGQVEGSWLSIDADFGDGVRWQRERMPLFRITASKPSAQDLHPRQGPD